MTDEAAAARVHEAVNGYLEDGELVVAWCIVIDVAGPNEVRYLALGMLRASTQAAEEESSWTAMQRLAGEVNWRCFRAGRGHHVRLLAWQAASEP